MSTAPLSFGSFELDVERGVLLRSGVPVTVSRSGILVLTALLEADGGVVTKEHLLERGWPNAVVEEANLTVQIGKLRSLLKPDGVGPDMIATVPRVGYRLVRAESAIASALGSKASIAVLPFHDLGGTTAHEHLADGLVDDLITGLSRFRTFAVVGRSASFAFKGRSIAAKAAASELDVRYLLEGSIRQSAGRIRINAQLIEGATGVQIWAEKFEGAPTDLFDFQDSITQSVIGLVEPQIQYSEIERVRQKRPDSLDAWDLYVQAVPLVHSARVADYNAAIDLLGRAIAIDPTYTPALTFASWAHKRRLTYGGTAAEGVDDKLVALSLAERAVAADPNDALALALLGWERMLFLNNRSGLELCERALALNPNNRSVLDLASVAHIFGGQLDTAIDYSLRALKLSPVAPDNYACAGHIATAHFLSGRFDDAVMWGRRSIHFEEHYFYSHLYLALSLVQLGRTKEAQQELDFAMSIWPEFELSRTVNDMVPNRWEFWIEGVTSLQKLKPPHS